MPRASGRRDMRPIRSVPWQARGAQGRRRRRPREGPARPHRAGAGSHRPSARRSPKGSTLTIATSALAQRSASSPAVSSSMSGGMAAAAPPWSRTSISSGTNARRRGPAAARAWAPPANRSRRSCHGARTRHDPRRPGGPQPPTRSGRMRVVGIKLAEIAGRLLQVRTRRGSSCCARAAPHAPRATPRTARAAPREPPSAGSRRRCRG